MTDAENQVAQAALDYLNAGWQPVPVRPNSKKPVHDDWPNMRLTAADVPQQFTAHKNIGLLLGAASNGLVDLDLDCPEAVALAPAFLPATGFKSGRLSNPVSHYWYTGTPLPEHREFEFDGKTLVELRTVGQTVVPPSLHQETGEQLVWHEADGAPAKVAGGELSRVAGELAAATLLTRHWKTSTRHKLALPLAGFLLRQQGWDEARSSHFVNAVATAAGDDEITDRLKAIETTAECLAKNEPANGGPVLRELLGGPVFDKFCEWLGFTRPARFTLPTIEADNVAPDEIPEWPADTLEGDYIADLTFTLYRGTSVPPQFLREQTVAVLAALADGKLGYPLHRDLPMRRFLALISERAGAGKGESWKRLTANTGTGGALWPLLGNLKLLNGSGIGSGQYLAKELEENPHALCHWDESSQLFQVTGQQCCTLFSALKSLYESNSHWTGSFTNKKHGGDDLHLSVLLHSTRKTFVDGFALRGGVGDGLLSRFTLVYSAGMPVVPEWQPRNLGEERKLVTTIGKLIPKVTTVPTITSDARERMNDFARSLYGSGHPHPDHVRRLVELTKIDLLHRTVYSGSPQITLEMVERSVAWGEHQLALRVAFWPSDAKNEIAAMTQVLLGRLRKGSASANDLRRAGNVDREGSHETFNRALCALTRSRKVIVVGKNSKGREVYGLEPEA
jgi:hypothetical protein